MCTVYLSKQMFGVLHHVAFNGLGGHNNNSNNNNKYICKVP